MEMVSIPDDKLGDPTSATSSLCTRLQGASDRSDHLRNMTNP